MPVRDVLADEVRTPWVEGAALALLVLAVVSLGGETVRASYHGYLHTTIGEAVLREGLLPENPYHAGTPLRYYTLYPALGVALGRLGFGPLWGYALLNVVAALLFGPALDALGRALGLGFGARRAGFLAAVLGLNGLGWIVALGVPGAPWGSVPLQVLGTMTGTGSAWGWDPRLDAFLSKQFNATSFAPSLPFALWSLAAAAAPGGRARKLVLPLGLSLALSPLVGALTAACVVGWKMPALLRGRPLERLAWPAAGLASCLVALPFLLPAFLPAPSGPPALPVELRGPLLSNLAGPLLLLLVPAIVGLGAWKRAPRAMWLWAVSVSALLLLAGHGRLPFGNEYKFARVGAILWALPAASWASAMVRRAGALRYVPYLLVLAALPGPIMVVAGYLAWGSAAPVPPLLPSGGRLALRPELRDGVLPAAILAAERDAPADAVLLLHPGHPGSRMGGGAIQGNALAPLFRHPLVVDAPQIHNSGQPDLSLRRERARVFWGTASRLEEEGQVADRAAALDGLRELFPDRPLLALSHDSLPEVQALLRQRATRALARANGFTLWLLPAPGRATGGPGPVP